MSEKDVIVRETRSKPVVDVGNEHSTLKNPYGIMTESSYNVYVDFANYCKVTSGRQNVTYDQGKAFFDSRKNYLNSLKKQVKQLREKQGGYQTKVDIDNLFLKINPLESGLREFNYLVANVFTKVLKKPRASFSRVVKTSLEYKFKTYQRGMFGKAVTVNNEYKEILSNIGSKALQLRNSYVD